jgi:anaphase-promoting complex subunit 1
MFDHFFSMMQSDWSPAKFVEALFAAGVDLFVLETLPEAVLAPLQEAIVQCQTEPPTYWSKDLLAIVGREDVNTLLVPGQRPRHTQTTILVRAKYSIGVLILIEAGTISRSKPGCPLYLLICR